MKKVKQPAASVKQILEGAQMPMPQAVQQPQAQPTITPYQQAINRLTEEHKEKGTLAFDLLKAMIQTRKELILDSVETHQQMITSAYQLADLFKREMDTRWGVGLQKTAERFNPASVVKESPKAEEVVAEESVEPSKTQIN